MNPPPSAISAPYATWKSPITPELLASGSTSIMNMQTDGDNTYWCEMRPSNKGRYTLVRRDLSGKLEDMTPPDFNVRTFVHEYGGGAFTVSNGIIFASCAADRKIYVIVPGQAPQAVTEGQVQVDHLGKSQWQGTRFADLRLTSHGLIAIGETHEPGKPVENFLSLIDTSSGHFKKLASGYDFYASPAISPDEKHIAWISWNHPAMPWTKSELWVADIGLKGELFNKRCIASEAEESVLQPQWSAHNTLFFISDRDNGWWNLHCYQAGKIENVCPIAAEVGEPLWIFGRSTYAFMDDHIVFAYNSLGRWHLGLLNPQTKHWKEIKRDARSIQHVYSSKNGVQFLEGYAAKEEALVHIENNQSLTSSILFQKPSIVSEGYISTPEHISFPSNGRTAYGFYYPPRNQDFTSPAKELPPLVVMIHGGPTSQAKGVYSLAKQYWTSQGFAVLDVNYGGSTGYGRKYRDLLNHNWGIVDVEDCIHGALFLAKQGKVDQNKLVIRGGSAGGFTTLAALAFHNTFKAGADYYGVADLTALAHDTHKFEQKYLDSLIGKYPEEKALWEKRSPIHAVNHIKSPLIIFQGEDDPIVPKNQSVMIYEALKKQKIPTEIHIYPGEEHGFRQAAHIIHAAKREADFYREIFYGSCESSKNHH